jgi:uncharacterized protein YdeI (YjbR/CyaY-like superfamily)
VSDAYAQLEITSRDQWREWLAAHHADSPGIWVVTHKKAHADLHVPYEAVVEEALCFGWIDSLGRRLDDVRSQLLLTPRKPGSGWSRINKRRIERLQAAGLMRPAGEAVVATAKRDGSWTALDAIEALEEPDDLRAALDADPAARRQWDGFPRSAKRAILAWIAAARRPRTRERRVAQTATLAAQGIRADEWRPPASG